MEKEYHMITKIGPYNNRVHFQALIKIKKSGIGLY